MLELIYVFYQTHFEAALHVPEFIGENNSNFTLDVFLQVLQDDDMMVTHAIVPFLQLSDMLIKTYQSLVQGFSEIS